MHYAKLIFSLWEYRVYRFTKPCQIVMTANESVLHTAVFEVCTYACIARLKMLESEHNNEQYRLDDTISQAKIAIKNYEHAIEGAKKDVEFAKKNVLPEDGFKVEVYGKVYTDRKEAGTALRQAAVSFIANSNGTIHQPIGTFRGFELAIEKCVDVAGSTYAQIAVRNNITYTTNIDLSGDIGNTTRLDNLVNDGIGKKLADMEKKCEQARNDLQAALENKGKPFEHADELAKKNISA